MAKYDPQKATAKQLRRAQEASQDYVDGVMSVTEAPGVKAVRKKDKMRANFLAKLDDGTWERNTSAVSAEEWRTRTAKKGGERYGSGVAEAEPDILAFHEEFAGFMSSHKARIDAMPDTTKEQRIAKMVENARGIGKFRRTRRRR